MCLWLVVKLFVSVCGCDSKFEFVYVFLDGLVDGWLVGKSIVL